MKRVVLESIPRRMSLRWLIRRAGVPGVVSGIASLLVMVAMLVFLTQSLQPKLDDLRLAQRATRDAHDAMLDQETGVRGYLASGDDDFLAPYRSGAKRSADLEGSLAASLSTEPELVKRAVDTITTQHAWQTQWAIPAAAQAPAPAIDVDGDGNVTPGEMSDFLSDGKRLFDNYRAADNRLQNAVRAKIRSVESQYTLVFTTASASLVVLAGLCIALLIGSGRRLQRLVADPIDDLTARLERAREGELDIGDLPRASVTEIAGLFDGVVALTTSLADRRSAGVARETELRHRGERLERVLDLSRDLTESLSLRYTTLRLVNAVCELTQADSADLWLHGATSEEMVLFASAHDEHVGEERQGSRARQVIDVGVGAIGRAARYGRALPLDETSSLVDEHSRGVAIPMVVGARVVAVISIESASQPLDLSLIDGLLLQGASAIQAAQLHAEVEEISHKDALTGLSNRRQFDADLAAEVERSHRYDRPLTLIMLDLDHFKRINDVYGHQRGDEVLQDVAGMLTTDLREIDTAYRYGGEELCILMPECTADEGARAAERLRERVASSFGWATTAAVTVSAGVAQLGSDASPAGLVGSADQALYAAKNGGRNRVVLAD